MEICQYPWPHRPWTSHDYWASFLHYQVINRKNTVCLSLLCEVVDYVFFFLCYQTKFGIKPVLIGIGIPPCLSISARWHCVRIFFQLRKKNDLSVDPLPPAAIPASSTDKTNLRRNTATCRCSWGPWRAVLLPPCADTPSLRGQACTQSQPRKRSALL